jgi:acyl-CoA thioester hydrolase
MKYYDNEIRIRYAETDQMGVSYYANHFIWFEESRTEYFRARGLLYTDFEKQGFFLPVVEAHCRYHAPTRYDDLIFVRTWISEIKRTSLRFSYEIRNKKNNELVSEGHTIHVFVNREFKPVRIPESITRSVEVVEKPL